MIPRGSPWLVLGLAACSLETSPLRTTGDGEVTSPHAHDWADHTGPAGGVVGVGTSQPSAVVHVQGTASARLTGTVSVAAGDSDVVGTGTAFTGELAVGDAVKIGDELHVVKTIANDTSLVLELPHAAGAQAAELLADPALLAIDTAAGGKRVRITRSGRVGVGVADPAAALHVAGGTRSDSFGSWRATYRPNSNNFTVALPPLADWDLYLITVRAACDYNGGDWSFFNYTFAAQTLAGYPRTQTATSVSTVTSVARDNNRTSRATIVGLNDGGLSLTVSNCMGKDVHVMATRFGS